jgi:type IV pilus assembly protein PilC
VAKFSFEAKAANGKDMRGEIDATSEGEARVKLRAQRLVPTRVTLAEKKSVVVARKFKSASIKPKDLQILTRQLATLIGSGIPILQSIDTLAQSARTPAVNMALRMVASDISRGKRFGDSLAEHPKMFGKFYVNMVRAGEESGNLDQILQRLAVYIEKSVKITNKVKGALTYPIVILIVAGLVVAGLLIFIIPKFQALFQQLNGEMPALTLFVIGISNVLVKFWWMAALGMFVTGYIVKVYYDTENGRRVFDQIFIKLPLFGTLIQKSAIAKFTRTLSTLLGSGVSIVDSLEIAGNTVGNYVVERAILRAKDAITEGKSLTVPLAKEKYIPQMVTQMISIGEQTGALDQMLSKIADFYEDEVDVAVSSLTQLIEPIMMVVLGAIIAFIVVAMYLPIFNIAGAIG